MGSVSKSYMRIEEGLPYIVYEEMCKYLIIYVHVQYEEAVSHRWLCNCSLLNFLIYEENLIFFFISAPHPQQTESSWISLRHSTVSLSSLCANDREKSAGFFVYSCSWSFPFFTALLVFPALFLLFLTYFFIIVTRVGLRWQSARRGTNSSRDRSPSSGSKF